MDPLHVVILLFSGLTGGFVAGLVGVGGGIVFAPVLFFFFQATGVAPEFLAPMTVGTSLLCTLTASAMSGWQHHLKRSVRWDISIRVGFLSAAALYLVVSFVTTEPWYDRFAFQLVFGLLLLIVAIRMFFENGSGSDENVEGAAVSEHPSTVILGAIGSAAGTVAALAGVGGGVVMVPAFHQILRLPMRVSVGTSSGAIILISTIGVTVYAISGWSEVTGPWMLGYVDIAGGTILGVPGILGARIGARLAHHLPRKALRGAFAVIALVVAGRMIVAAVSGM